MNNLKDKVFQVLEKNIPIVWVVSKEKDDLLSNTECVLKEDVDLVVAELRKELDNAINTLEKEPRSFVKLNSNDISIKEIQWWKKRIDELFGVAGSPAIRKTRFYNGEKK